MKFSIRNKLAVGFGLCVLLLVAAVIFFYASLHVLENLFQETLRRSADLELATHAMHIGHEMDQVIGNAVIIRDMAKTERDWAATKKESLAMLQKLAMAADTPEEHAQIRAATAAADAIIRKFEQEVLPLILKGEGVLPGTLAKLDIRIDERIDDITLALERVAASMSEENRAASREFRGVLRNTITFGLIVSLIGVIAVITVSTLTTGRIVRPLEEITLAAQKIMNGDYHGELRRHSDDEIGLLAATFDNMSATVEKRTAELMESNERLQHEIGERKAAEENVRSLNVELEQRVVARTAELLSSREQLRKLSQYLQTAREEERAAIAREIHDELGQQLTVLKMDVSWLGGKLPDGQRLLSEKTREMARQIDQTIKAVQRISAELRPGILDDLGLEAAIEWQAEEFRKRTGILFEVRSSMDCSRLDRSRSTALFRIVQEALTNICRHAEATRARVTLSDRDGEVVATMTDNGKGITEKQISDSDSIGLIGIRERVHAFGGKVEIHRLMEGGTRVQVTLPLG